MLKTLKIARSPFSAIAVLAVAAFALATSAGCDQPSSRGSGGDSAAGGPGAGATPIAVDHARATETVTQNLRSNVGELDDSLQFLEASDLLPELLAFAPQAADEVGEAVVPGDDLEVEVEASVDVALQEPLEELIERLREQVFVEGGVEDDGDDRTVVYRLDPERVCPEADDAGEGAQGRDADCVRQLTDVRVRVSSFADGDVDLALLVGDDRLEVARAQIHRNLLAVELDFGALRSAAELLIDADDEDAPELPGVMEGVVRAELRRNGERDFTAALSIERDIRVEHRSAEGEIAIRLGRTPALASVRLDGVAKVITAQLGLGEVEVAVPWQQIVDAIYEADAGGGCAQAIGPDGEPGPVDCWEDEPEPAPEVDGTFRAFLAGLTGRTSFSGDEDRIEVTDLTLGAESTTIAVDRDTLVAVDLNKDSGRKLAVALQEVRNGNLRVEVTPGLDLQLAFALHHVADLFEEIPPFMLDETLGIRLDAAGAAAPVLETVGQDEEGRQLRISEGELTLWSTAMDDDVIIGEGMCVGGPEREGEPDEGAHPLFGGIEAVDCGL